MKLELTFEGSTVQQKASLTPLHQWLSRVGFHTPFPLEAYTPAEWRAWSSLFTPTGLLAQTKATLSSEKAGPSLSAPGSSEATILYIYFKSLLPAPLLCALRVLQCCHCTPPVKLFLYKLMGGGWGWLLKQLRASSTRVRQTTLGLYVHKTLGKLCVSGHPDSLGF